MKPIHILLAEDNEGDIMLTLEGFEERDFVEKISVVKDGREAIDFLDKKGHYSESPTPDLILLDVNLPRKNGHEILQYIKDSDGLKQIPVIMLTTSSSEKDIMKSYMHHANCYIVKPVEADHFMKVIASIENFWISVAELPVNN